MKKIIVIGPSGAGKTTLAAELSSLLHAPHTELDSLYHQANWQLALDDEFMKRVRTVTDAPEWILCGNYYSKLSEEIWPRADMIIWCNYSFARVFGRLLRRTLTRGFVKTELWNGNRESLYRNLFTKQSVILWMLRSWKKQNRRYNELFSDSNNFPGVMLLRLKTPKDTRRLLRSLR